VDEGHVNVDSELSYTVDGMHCGPEAVSCMHNSPITQGRISGN